MINVMLDHATVWLYGFVTKYACCILTLNVTLYMEDSLSSDMHVLGWYESTVLPKI